MRTLLRILALVPLVLPAVGPATSGAATIGGTPADVVSSMAGHWRCTSSTGSVSHRSFVVTDGGGTGASGVTGSATTRVAGGIRSSVNTPGAAGSAAVGIARTVYGRQDGPDAGPFFERIVERTDRTLTMQSSEGAGSGALGDASSIRFTALTTTPATTISEEAARGGTGGSNASSAMRYNSAPAVQPVSLSYTVEPSGLRRIARVGSQTLSDDRCTRDVATSSAVCSAANVAPSTLHAVQPMVAQEGAVQLRLTLDDRGRVVGEDVLASSSPSLTQSAIMAARDSTFTAAVTDCRAVSTQHAFGVQFHADAQRRSSSNGRETNL
ncbi:MAG TPA: energy transducer TonB [Candidatus Elarobacter sp.]